MVRYSILFVLYISFECCFYGFLLLFYFFFLLNMGWFVMADACSIFYTTASRSISLIREGFLFGTFLHYSTIHLHLHWHIGGLNFFFKIFVSDDDEVTFNLVPGSYHYISRISMLSHRLKNEASFFNNIFIKNQYYVVAKNSYFSLTIIYNGGN